MAKQKFSDWFDPQNIEHLKAYKHLQENAVWPVGFKPDVIEMDRMWQYAIVTKIAEYYIEWRLLMDDALDKLNKMKNKENKNDDRR